MTADARMTELTQGLTSKSEKMRRLAKAGYSRGDIARHLGTSYQFVRNVLVREEARPVAAVKTSNTPLRPTERHSNRVRLGPSGSVALPVAITQALGLKEGDALIATVEDDEIRLMTIPTAVRKVQAMLRQHVPEGVSLVDELLEDRRREVEAERQE